jgi:hypothetical protein
MVFFTGALFFAFLGAAVFSWRGFAAAAFPLGIGALVELCVRALAVLPEVFSVPGAFLSGLVLVGADLARRVEALLEEVCVAPWTFVGCFSDAVRVVVVFSKGFADDAADLSLDLIMR